MVEQKFEVKGTFKIGDDWKPYTKVVGAPNSKQAEERVYATIGSKHRLKRMYITINGITPVDGE